MLETDTNPTPREIIDPEGTLPPVELMPDAKARVVKGSLIPKELTIITDGEPIGSLVFVEDKVNKEAWLNGVEIDQELKGQGFGLAAYLAAIEQAQANGETFRTHDWSQTQDAVRVWQRFIDAGIAEVIEPFHGYKNESGESLHFTGHVRIPTTSTS